MKTSLAWLGIVALVIAAFAINVWWWGDYYPYHVIGCHPR